MGLSIFAMTVTTLFIPESPKYLFATGQYEKSRQVLAYISRMNGNDASDFDSVRFGQEERLSQRTRSTEATSDDSLQVVQSRAPACDEEEKESLVPLTTSLDVSTGGTGESQQEAA